MAEKYGSKLLCLPLYSKGNFDRRRACHAEKCLVELYTDEDVENLRRKIRRWRAVLCAISVLAMCMCVTFAASADTANAGTMEFAAVVTSIAAGWIVLYCAMFPAENARRELRHAGTLRDGKRERVEGKVTVTRRWLRIKKSITAREVVVETPEGRRQFWVVDSRAMRLSRDEPSAICISHGYVAAYEVSV